jgi:circadian clock protein KaiB
MEGEATYRFCLYVSGMTRRSTEAYSTLRKLCDESLAGRYEIVVIDIYQKPEMTPGRELVALPMLVRTHPGPMCRLVGNLSDAQRVQKMLEIHPRAA